MSFFKRLNQYKKVNQYSSSDSDEANLEEEIDVKLNDDIKKPVEKTAVRGKVAALLANLNESNDESDSDDNIKNNYRSNTGNKPALVKQGIYSMKINETKKERKMIDNKFYHVEKNLIENECNLNVKELSSDECEIKSDKSSSNEFSDHSSTNDCIKKKRLEKEDSPVPISPPPPSSCQSSARRKSTSKVSKQLKELESLRMKNFSDQVLINSDQEDNDDDDDDLVNTITVRVSTKSGLHKWELKENEQFMYIFEQLAKIEQTNIENLVLMLKERIINFNDTPASLNLKVYDIIDCGKTANVFQEKIKIIENDEDCQQPANMIMIILQTEEGRKSRMKFLINKNEKFENVLKKYCDKRELNYSSLIMEFDGDKVILTDTPDDLDLDGGEIFDVKKGTKPMSELIKEKSKLYQFDDDILIE